MDAEVAPAGLDATQFQRNKEFMLEFLRQDAGSEYADLLRSIADESSKQDSHRVILNMNTIRKHFSDKADQIIQQPMDFITPFQEAMQEYVKGIGAMQMSKEKPVEIQVGFEGAFGAQSLSPRALLSRFLCTLVSVEGIVTKCSLVQPKMVRSVHYCEKTNSHISREYRDATAMDIGLEVGGRPRLPTNTTYPTKDDKGNPLETEFGLSTFKNHQSVTIQEMPERAPLGQLPRSVDLIMDHDLVDKVKPGDRVQCVGVYRPLSNGGTNAGATTGVFGTKLLCNNVQVMGRDIGAVSLTEDDMEQIRLIAQREDVWELLGRSFAPSICGHEYIKKALVLQLLGGVEKNLENGTHLRGDINILMVGDPSTAKSQLLRAAMNVAPLAVSTTGKGSSGVGLTAAVTQDAETGERRLEAGAMVLADRGTVCIDEFDKMGEADRVAIHEVMEQQTVTVAKAGIHASLNARCSVLAAANPIYGQYNKARRPQDNIALPDSLLSRFDLLFVVLDQMDPESDRRISSHVLRGHMYRRPGTDMEPDPLDAGAMDRFCGEKSDEPDPIWEKMQSSLYSGSEIRQKRRKTSHSNHEGGVLHKSFLKKYIHYAKTRIHPTLSDEAREYIATEYAQLRAKARETNRTLPVTARQLETLIRLSTAHAKARLSDVVEEKDAIAAQELLQFALYHEAGESAAATQVEDSDEPDEVLESDSSDVASEEEDEVTNTPAAVDLSSLMPGNPRFDAFRAVIPTLFEGESADLGVKLSDVADTIINKAGQFTWQEMEAILLELEKENLIMYEDGVMYSI